MLEGEGDRVNLTGAVFTGFKGALETAATPRLLGENAGYDSTNGAIDTTACTLDDPLASRRSSSSRRSRLGSVRAPAACAPRS